MKKFTVSALATSIILHFGNTKAAEIKDEDLITMDLSKIVVDGGDSLTFKGRFSSDGIAYKNNLYVGTCRKSEMVCWITVIDQLAPLQIHADAPAPYDIKKWNKDEILIDDGNDIPAFICYKNTITINRKNKDVVWYITPVNQHERSCQSLPDKTVIKMILSDSLGVTKMKKALEKK
jgi:hypothetical protein